MMPEGGLIDFQDALSSRTRITALWHAAMFICLLTGCSTGSGLLIADVYRTEGAWVVAIEGFGATVRTLADDAGLTLGYERRTYVYPERIDDPPPEGRHYFFVRLPKKAPVAVNTRAVGLNVRASNVDFGLTLGYRDATLLARVPVGESLYIRLRFLPDDVGATRLTYCPEEDPCWPIDIPNDALVPR
jgi:hypothetical protein